MEILAEVLALQEPMIELRRTIHRHPELGWQEYETQKLILRELQALQIPCEPICGTGVLGIIRGEKPGPVTGLRADMDALPVAEKNESEYSSRVAGKMHACGHDCHVAMLLTAAKVIQAHRDELCGTVKLIFQPAEEIIEGAHAVSQIPQLEDLDRIGGAHVWIDLDVGTFSIEAGPRLACADNIYLKVKGKSAHGAQPHRSVDAIVAACAIVEQLQTAVSRRIDPLEPAVVSIGTIQGGTLSNIIASEVAMSGTVRCFSPELRAQLPDMLKDIACKTAAIHGAECEFEYRPCTPPVINQRESVQIMRGSAEKLFGENSLVHLEKTMGGEDFAWYLQKFKGCFAFVGCRNEAEGKCWPHHHECFDVDERALINGAALLAQFAFDAGNN